MADRFPNPPASIFTHRVRTPPRSVKEIVGGLTPGSYTTLMPSNDGLPRGTRHERLERYRRQARKQLD